MEGLLEISGCDNPSRIADVIFVHGLDGDARTAWHPKDKPEGFWPTWLGQDFPNVGIWSLGYAVSASAWEGPQHAAVRSRQQYSRPYAT